MHTTDTLDTAAAAETPTLDAAPITNADAILAALDAALAPNTLATYRQRWTAMQRHFLARGWEFVPVRAHDDATDDERTEFIARWCSYLTDLNEQGKSLALIQQAHAACRWGANRAGGDADLLHDRRIRQVLRGIRRSHDGESRRTARALSIAEIRHVVSTTPETLTGLRDKALLLLGIATALRSANLADLRISDITPVSTLGVEVTVRRTKTTSEPIIIPVRRNESDLLLDPVEAVLSYARALRAHGATDDQFLFQRINGTDAYTGKGMTPAAITPLLRRRLDASGVRTDGVSSHSLRSTFITLSYAAGVPEASIARISLHRNLTVLRSYDRSTYWESATTAIWKEPAK